jgi:hypothetical protein
MGSFRFARLRRLYETPGQKEETKLFEQKPQNQGQLEKKSLFAKQP